VKSTFKEAMKIDKKKTWYLILQEDHNIKEEDKNIKEKYYDHHREKIHDGVQD